MKKLTIQGAVLRWDTHNATKKALNERYCRGRWFSGKKCNSIFEPFSQLWSTNMWWTFVILAVEYDLLTSRAFLTTYKWSWYEFCIKSMSWLLRANRGCSILHDLSSVSSNNSDPVGFVGLGFDLWNVLMMMYLGLCGIFARSRSSPTEVLWLFLRA